jgi:hypothetical protein
MSQVTLVSAPEGFCSYQPMYSLVPMTSSTSPRGSSTILVSPFGADEKSGGDEAGGVELVGRAASGGEELGAGGGVGGLVGDGPEDDGGLVAVAADHFGELLFGLGEDGGVVEVERPVDGDLAPDQDAAAVGFAGHALVVGVVGEADVVAAELLGPVEEGVDVGFSV